MGVRTSSTHLLRGRSSLGSLLSHISKRRTGAPTAANPGSRRAAATVAIGLLAALSGLAYLGDHAMLVHTRRSVASELSTLLHAEAETLRVWGRSHRRLANTLARDPRVRREVRALAVRPRTDLLGDRVALTRFAAMLRPIVRRHGYAGCAVLRHDGEVILFREQVERLSVSLAAIPSAQRALQGRTTISPPSYPRDVVRGNDVRFGALPPRMHVVAPVWDDAGGVAAALALNLVAEDEFTRLLRIARMGETGETYAFDRRGRMVSDSRFDTTLRAIGLLPQDPATSSMLSVEIRDPGVDLTRGQRAAMPRQQQPLTRMARAALAGKSGVDVDGYRDYRGVRVVGAWTWLPDLEIGLATEMDHDEAFASQRGVRAGFWILVALLMLASLGLVAYAVLTRRQQQSLQEARALGQYTLGEKIGAGGMGSVYRGHHALLARPTAIKLLDVRDATPERATRFEREVQATAKLTHPNTVAVYDYGRTPEGTFYYAMELLDGRSLQQVVEAEGPLPPTRVVHVLLQVLGSLSEAHGVGLVHRDVKPANVMLTIRGGVLDFVKVLDFGLVRSLASRLDARLTQVDALTGTPMYMSPEQIVDPDAIDARSDIYQVGAVAYYLLSGTEPFGGASVVEILNNHVDHDPVPPSERLGRPLPRDLEALVMRCMARDATERPASAEALIALLEALGLPTWTRADAARAWERSGAFPIRHPVPARGPAAFAETQSRGTGDGSRENR